MSVIVRTYELVGEPENPDRFFARAIAQDRPRKGQSTKSVEGFSVGFYADTAEGATAKAHAWIETERQRQIEIAGNRAAAAEKTRQAATAKTGAAA